jgi:hypothetical protein
MIPVWCCSSRRAFGSRASCLPRSLASSKSSSRSSSSRKIINRAALGERRAHRLFAGRSRHGAGLFGAQADHQRRSRLHRRCDAGRDRSDVGRQRGSVDRDELAERPARPFFTRIGSTAKVSSASRSWGINARASRPISSITSAVSWARCSSPKSMRANLSMRSPVHFPAS